MCYRINEPTQHHLLSLQPHLFQRSERYSVCTDISRLFELCMMLAWVELCVLQSLTEGNGYYSSIAAQILPHIETSDSRVLVYTNFVKDTAPLAIALRETGLKTCSYHGQKMSSSDKCEALESWQKGVVKVMVCTSAFGMGINQPDVEAVISVGCPPSLEDMVQKFGRAGRDGRPAKGKYMCMWKSSFNKNFVSDTVSGILLYHESDLQHASFWCRSSPEQEVLPTYRETWK